MNKHKQSATAFSFAPKLTRFMLLIEIYRQTPFRSLSLGSLGRLGRLGREDRPAWTQKMHPTLDQSAKLSGEISAALWYPSPFLRD